jgi:hypothetical protein
MTLMKSRLLSAGAAALWIAAAQMPAGAATLVYDDFEAPGGYSLTDYQTKWINPYGLGEMALNDTRDFSAGNFAISAQTFQTGFDFSVYDHLKYIGVSTQAFAVPTLGSVTFSSVIDATTYGTQPGRIIEGTYIQSGDPYAAATLEGQQAAAVMNMIDFKTGQLFDWFISGDTAFTLIERLPSSVTNPLLVPGDPGYVGIDKMYTQIIDEVKIGPGPQEVSITYSRQDGVSFYLNGVLISQVTNVGIPLDQQGLPYSGIYPSYGPGENLLSEIDSFSIGHGLFSLLDAYPFQHPDRPDLAVSIPVANRIFGQGLDATFDDFKVITVETFAPGAVPEPASWALMIGGFALAGAAMRRRTPAVRFA